MHALSVPSYMLPKFSACRVRPLDRVEHTPLEVINQARMAKPGRCRCMSLRVLRRQCRRKLSYA
jgi:hypothetical protein